MKCHNILNCLLTLKVEIKLLSTKWLLCTVRKWRFQTQSSMSSFEFSQHLAEFSAYAIFLLNAQNYATVFSCAVFHALHFTEFPKIFLIFLLCFILLFVEFCLCPDFWDQQECSINYGFMFLLHCQAMKRKRAAHKEFSVQNCFWEMRASDSCERRFIKYSRKFWRQKKNVYINILYAR